MQKILFHDINIAVSRGLAEHANLFDEVVNIREATDVRITETLDTPTEAMSRFGVWASPSIVILDGETPVYVFCGFETVEDGLAALADPAAYQAAIDAAQQPSEPEPEPEEPADG